MHKLDWKLVKEEALVNDQWMHFKKQDYQFPDGSVHGPFYTYSIRHTVIIVAQDTQGDFLCVKQFRQDIGRTTVEFPAGGIEAKAVDQTVALEAAKRELLEETGYQSKDWKFLYKVASHATLADNDVYIFGAKNCVRVSDQALDETEFLDFFHVNNKQIETWIQARQFEQAMHILAWFFWKQEE